MELLRELGMRPTDVRRVVRKAPEVLAPRADGSTAAEAVDVSFCRQTTAVVAVAVGARGEVVVRIYNSTYICSAER